MPRPYPVISAQRKMNNLTPSRGVFAKPIEDTAVSTLDCASNSANVPSFAETELLDWNPPESSFRAEDIAF